MMRTPLHSGGRGGYPQQRVVLRSLCAAGLATALASCFAGVATDSAGVVAVDPRVLALADTERGKEGVWLLSYRREEALRLELLLPRERPGLRTARGSTSCSSMPKTALRSSPSRTSRAET